MGKQDHEKKVKDANKKIRNTSGLVKTGYNIKVAEIENKMSGITSLFITATLNAKATETENKMLLINQQKPLPSICVFIKRCSENMQQFYRRILMSKCKATLLKSNFYLSIFLKKRETKTTRWLQEIRKSLRRQKTNGGWVWTNLLYVENRKSSDISE